MLLRRFNDEGVARFRAFIADLRDDKTRPAPIEMLLDDALTEVIEPQTESPDAEFPNRLAAAEHLNALLAPAGLADAMGDVGLWCWLTLRHFDQVRPLPLPPRLGFEESRFVPSDVLGDSSLRSKRYHRHLLRHPLQVYRLVGGDAGVAMCFLVQPVHMPGDFIEQMASRQLYMRNPEMMGTLTALVVDPERISLRPGAASKARRLHDVLDQFDCTWDLGFIARDLLIPMLPDEFDSLRTAMPEVTEQQAASEV